MRVLAGVAENEGASMLSKLIDLLDDTFNWLNYYFTVSRLDL